jgi:hypothetical protein
VREHVVHLARQSLALCEHGSACLRLARLLELAEQLLRLLLPFREPARETGDDVERDHAELLEYGAERALVAPGDLRDRKGDEGERDDRRSRPSRNTHRRRRHGDEGAEECGTLRLQRDEHGRADDERREERQLRACLFPPAADHADDADAEPDECEQDPEVLAVEAGTRVRLRAGELDEDDHRDAERA